MLGDIWRFSLNTGRPILCLDYSKTSKTSKTSKKSMTIMTSMTSMTIQGQSPILGKLNKYTKLDG